MNQSVTFNIRHATFALTSNIHASQSTPTVAGNLSPSQSKRGQAGSGRRSSNIRTLAGMVGSAGHAAGAGGGGGGEGEGLGSQHSEEEICHTIWFVIFTAIVSEQGPLEEIDHAFSILTTMRVKGICPEEDVFPLLMDVCSSLGSADRAVQVNRPHPPHTSYLTPHTSHLVCESKHLTSDIIHLTAYIPHHMMSLDERVFPALPREERPCPSVHCTLRKGLCDAVMQ